MINVFLTRPQGENEQLTNKLDPSLFNVLERPLIELLDVKPDSVIREVAMNLDQWDLIVFVSKSAVRSGMPILDIYWPQWPQYLKWLAVGEGTAALLKDWQVAAVFPEKAGSEGLLALEALQAVNNRKVLIVRGSGGRELLATTLKQRGAEVDYWEVYRRQPVQQDFPLLDKDGADDGGIAVATSGEILEQLTTQLGEVTQSLQLVTVSERIAEAAEGHFDAIEIAAGASDEALYEAIKACADRMPQR